MKQFLLILFFVTAFSSAYTQTDKTQALARQYYKNGSYEKAASLFEELWKEQPQNYYYYTSLFNSLVRLNDFETLESVVKKQQKKFKTDIRYQIDMGYVFTLLNEHDKASKEYDNAISMLSANVNDIRTLANKFISYRKDELAVETYLKGNDLFKDKTKFAYELGNTYLRINKAKEAVQYWLSMLESSEQNMQRVQSMLTANINKEGVQDELETQLYAAVQKNSSSDLYPELLIWLFTQQKDFESALIQAKAIDKRKNEEGQRIMSLAYNAVREELYNAAIDAYEYQITKGSSNRYYVKAKSELLNARKLKIVTTPNYSQEDLRVLQSEYNNYLDTYGKNVANAQTIRDLANLEAKYLHRLDRAIELLEDLIALPNLKSQTRSQTKLDLGDYYVLSGDVWESTLLYAQVDKTEKDSPIGEDARFRNARLSYYKGEFEWAQAQLTILKGATTELIANDALDLSVFIMDNLGLDSTTTAMEMYASAALLASQNKPKAALSTLDSILFIFPNHALTDNVLLQKATIKFDERDYELAIAELDKLLMNHAEDILADDAAFMIGDIYQYYLEKEDKAMDYYKLVITDYSDSVLVVEARKRFRDLRGDV